MHLSKVLPSKISHGPFLRASGKCLSYERGQHLLPQKNRDPTIAVPVGVNILKN